MMTQEDLDYITEKTWRDAEKVFHRCLLHMAKELEGNKTMSASDGLREMARMFVDPVKTEVCVYTKRTLQ